VRDRVDLLTIALAIGATIKLVAEHSPYWHLMAALLCLLMAERVSLRWYQEDFRAGRQLLRVRQFGVWRWEVWDWGSPATARYVEHALSPLPAGSPEAYSRLAFMARRLYRGPDFTAARRLV
jgi:hypothetical protein